MDLVAVYLLDWDYCRHFLGTHDLSSIGRILRTLTLGSLAGRVEA